jgi:2-isopropylmalate synthase
MSNTKNNNQKHIKIFDTTLRDGEQCPGASMNVEEKVEVAKMLEKLNVDVIEAGFAVASPGDFASVKAVAETVTGPIVCSLSRAIEKDIVKSAEALKPAKRARIHTFIATSPIHMEYKLKMKPDEVIKRAVDAVKLAKSLVNDVEFSAEDASRSDQKFLTEILAEVIKAGATTLNIPDTVGYTVPNKFGELIKYLKANTPGIENCVISVHCHNDLGLAVANSLAAIQNGARQVECTINGIGERAGNASMEELVMILKTRKDLFDGLDTQIDPRHIYRASRLISQITGFAVQPNKAIVGANAFAHESGIHQDGILKHRETYEIMRAEDVGWQTNKLVLGKHSGRHAFASELKTMGYELTDEQINNAFEKFKELADKKKEIGERDLEVLIGEETKAVKPVYTLKSLQVKSGTGIKPTAELIIDHDGKEIKLTSAGDGPVDAIFKGIESAVKDQTGKINLIDFVVHAVTEGTDALGETSVRIKDDVGGREHIYLGRGANTDVLVASAEAYLAAINKMLYARSK